MYERIRNVHKMHLSLIQKKKKNVFFPLHKLILDVLSSTNLLKTEEKNHIKIKYPTNE